MLAQVWWAIGIFRHLVITYAKCIDVHYMTTYLTRNFFFSGGGGGGFPFAPFLYIISVVFFIIVLVVFLFAYIMSNIDLVLKGQNSCFRVSWSD